MITNHSQENAFINCSSELRRPPPLLHHLRQLEPASLRDWRARGRSWALVRQEHPEPRPLAARRMAVSDSRRRDRPISMYARSSIQLVSAMKNLKERMAELETRSGMWNSCSQAKNNIFSTQKTLFSFDYSSEMKK